jgi:hypothetical protein
MNKLTRGDLMSLEQYARERADFRARVLAHKKPRTVAVGPNMTWIFEDRLSVHYQVQEMLRAERIFEDEAIAEELGAYNPLIPDGQNWKVTQLIEFPDPDERRVRLAALKDVEHCCWIEVAGLPRCMAKADEDLDRSNDEKTAAVHFLCFELGTERVAALSAGHALQLGVDHPGYPVAVTASEATRLALIKDFA